MGELGIAGFEAIDVGSFIAIAITTPPTVSPAWVGGNVSANTDSNATVTANFNATAAADPNATVASISMTPTMVPTMTTIAPTMLPSLSASLGVADVLTKVAVVLKHFELGPAPHAFLEQEAARLALFFSLQEGLQRTAICAFMKDFALRSSNDLCFAGLGSALTLAVDVGVLGVLLLFTFTATVVRMTQHKMRHTIHAAEVARYPDSEAYEPYEFKPEDHAEYVYDPEDNSMIVTKTAMTNMRFSQESGSSDGDDGGGGRNRGRSRERGERGGGRRMREEVVASGEWRDYYEERDGHERQEGPTHGNLERRIPMLPPLHPGEYSKYDLNYDPAQLQWNGNLGVDSYDYHYNYGAQGRRDADYHGPHVKYNQQHNQQHYQQYNQQYNQHYDHVASSSTTAVASSSMTTAASVGPTERSTGRRHALLHHITAGDSDSIILQ
jgi:hypothetical protein